MRSRQQAAWPDGQPHPASPILFLLSCTVHETACPAVCLPAPGHFFADSQSVRSSPSFFTNKADGGRQPRLTGIYVTRNALRTLVPLKTCSLLRHCRLYSKHEDPNYRVSFAEALTDKEEDDEMDDAKSVTSNTSSGKRKRNAGPAFYAVRVGRAPGIYYSWPDCEAQIKGMKAECRLSNLVPTSNRLIEDRQKVRLSHRRRDFHERHA